MVKLNPKISFVEEIQYFEQFNFLNEKSLKFQNEVDSCQDTNETFMTGKSLRNRIT